jgi:hypothetical protein
MYLTHKEWLKVPILLEELRGLFEELPDEELDGLKKLAIQGKFAPEWIVWRLRKEKDAQISV